MEQTPHGAQRATPPKARHITAKITQADGTRAVMHLVCNGLSAAVRAVEASYPTARGASFIQARGRSC